MKFGSLNFLPLALYFFISPCAPLYYLPYHDEIEKMPVKNKEFDCVDKSTLYHKFLKERGIESKIVSGNVKGLPSGTIHAWVEIYNSEYNEWYIVDPTLFGREDKNDGLRVFYPAQNRENGLNILKMQPKKI